MSEKSQTVKKIKAGGDVLVAGRDLYYACQDDRVDLRAVIEKERERLKDRAILPWFSDSRSYRELFPGLFIKPALTGRVAEIGYDALRDFCGRNIAILGEAGAGKTTLLYYYFAFDAADGAGRSCLYFTAKDALGMVEGETAYIECVCRSIETSGLGPLTVLIDGVDEEFLNDYRGYIRFFGLLKRLSDCYPCAFWLGCRKDLFDQYRGEASQFVQDEFVISPWEESQARRYLEKYGAIVGRRELPEKIGKLIDREELFEAFSKNPFQLSLLAYIADRDEEDRAAIRNVYELYGAFFEVWFRKEKLRGTAEASIKTVLYPWLQEIAKRIYENSAVAAEDIDNENSAIRNLLVIQRSSYRGDRITAMYHRSMVSFLLAEQIVQNMLDGTKREELRTLFRMRLQDDVTNFVGSKYTVMTAEERERAKRNLIGLYREVKDGGAEDGFVVLEKCIYHLTRMNRGDLDADVTDFLRAEIDPAPENPYLRLTLAYGCALSGDETVRAFALDYARSISNETPDAMINRSWTLVYFGDVADDPYRYRDDRKCPWSKARAARIQAFYEEGAQAEGLSVPIIRCPPAVQFSEGSGMGGDLRGGIPDPQRSDVYGGAFFPE